MEDRFPWEGPFEARPVYIPAVRPGFAAWATVFACPGGGVGLSFDEVVREKNPAFLGTKLEMAEAACVPVSYGSVECGTEDRTAYRVFMHSRDGVNFTETGRCLRSKGAYCCAALPDGRLIGFDVPRRNEDGTAWADWLRVQESRDGGSTWRGERRILKGNTPYMWRVRTLRDGTVVLLLSLQGSPWGVERERQTRHTAFPGETMLNRVQACFITTRDGMHFSPPHYILPGIGAHEYDMCEPKEGTMLFIAGDVQGTPAGRQTVRRTGDGWINDPLLPIRRGAPADPSSDPQGGFLPETFVWDERSGCILGYRRNQGYCLSADLGENWVRTEPDQGVPKLYQPMMIPLSDGYAGLYGHVGGDSAFGQHDMLLWGHRLRADCAHRLPSGASLSLKRCMNDRKTQFINCFEGRLICPGRNTAGKKLRFCFLPFWNKDGSVNTEPLDSSSPYLESETDASGTARARVPLYDGIPDIHLAYRIWICWPGDGEIAACDGPSMTVLSFTPVRGDPFPYDGFFAEGTLYLSPDFLRCFPGALEDLQRARGLDVLPTGILPPEAEERLLACGVLRKGDGGGLCWIRSVHAPRALNDVKPMLTGDEYQ